MFLYNKRIFKRCFNYTGKRWFKNIKEIPLYFKLIHYLIKYGYDEYATWETDRWFIYTMKEILSSYKEPHRGVPVVIDNYPKFKSSNPNEDERLIQLNRDTWILILDKMISLLDLMDKTNPIYECNTTINYIAKTEKVNKAKNEFFELFAKYFYELWD